MQETAIAVVIKDPDVLDTTERALSEVGLKVFGFPTEDDALPQIEQLGIGLIMAELSPAAARSSRLLPYLRQRPSIALIALHHSADRLDIVDSLNGLPYDAAPYPIDTAGLVRMVGRASERLALVAEVARLKAALAEKANGNNETFQIPTLPETGISLQNIERELLVKALEKFRGNQTRTARYLNISRRTLIYRIGKYKLRESGVAHAHA